MRLIGQRILVCLAAAGVLVSCGERGIPGRVDPGETASGESLRKPDWKKVYRMHTGVMELSLLKKDLGARDGVEEPEENQEKQPDGN